MTQTYKKVLGSSRLFQYNRNNLYKAADAVKRGMSVRRASEKFEVPKSTLHRHSTSADNLLKHGRPTAISEMEENILEKMVLKCAEYGFPMKFQDIKALVQSYLNSLNQKEKRFVNNKPGDDWVHQFLERHPNIAVRLCENIKRARSAVNAETINDYFDNLSKELEGVPPSNIINFDETNFTDDPASVKVLARRGSRRVERTMDTSKTSTSVMISVAADGTMLPPYIFYKATYVYPLWTENGPPGDRYGASKSGWFDMDSFEDWFENEAVPYLTKKIGSRVAIGDNLASHISPRVIELCELHDIRFLLLTPNSTHLTQPEDVAVFRPLKGTWKTGLEGYKMKHRGVLPKALFPKFLKSAFDQLGEKMSANIKAGFRACGIVPLDREQVLKRLPRLSDQSNEEFSANAWSLVFEEKLQNMRSEITATKSKGGKKFQIKAGRSARREDLCASETTVILRDDVRCSDEDIDNPGNDSDHATGSSSIDENVEPVFKEKDFVLVKFITEKDNRRRLFMGQIVNILDCENYELKFLRKNVGTKETYFTFPNIPDVETVKIHQIVCKHKETSVRRSRYVFRNLKIADLKNVE